MPLVDIPYHYVIQKLPAVGPKSAFVIQQYRDLHDGIKTIEELKDIPGLAKTFYNKFCVQNQVKEVSEEEERKHSADASDSVAPPEAPRTKHEAANSASDRWRPDEYDWDE